MSRGCGLRGPRFCLTQAPTPPSPRGRRSGPLAPRPSPSSAPALKCCLVFMGMRVPGPLCWGRRRGRLCVCGDCHSPDTLTRHIISAGRRTDLLPLALKREISRESEPSFSSFLSAQCLPSKGRDETRGQGFKCRAGRLGEQPGLRGLARQEPRWVSLKHRRHSPL